MGIYALEIIVFGSSFLFILLDVHIYSCGVCYLIDAHRGYFLTLVVSNLGVVSVGKGTVIVYIKLTVRLRHIELVIDRIKLQLSPTRRSILQRIQCRILSIF